MQLRYLPLPHCSLRRNPGLPTLRMRVICGDTRFSDLDVDGQMLCSEIEITTFLHPSIFILHCSLEPARLPGLPAQYSILV
jgi:hypothetical protein